MNKNKRLILQFITAVILSVLIGMFLCTRIAHSQQSEPILFKLKERGTRNDTIFFDSSYGVSILGNIFDAWENYPGLTYEGIVRSNIVLAAVTYEKRFDYDNLSDRYDYRDVWSIVLHRRNPQPNSVSPPPLEHVKEFGTVEFVVTARSSSPKYRDTSKTFYITVRNNND